MKNGSSLSAKALWLTLSKIITLLISLLTGMLLSRFRTLEEYGTYSEIMTVITLVVSVLTLGLPNSINYFLPRAENQEERDEFLSVYYTCTTILSAVMGALLVICAPLIVLYFDNPQILLYTYGLGVLPWTKVIIGGRSNMLVASDRINREIAYNILNSTALLGIIVLTRILNQTFSFYLILYTVTEAVFALAVYMETAGLVHRFRVSINFTLLRSILIFSLPMGISAALGTLCTEVDKLMIGWFYDTKMVAIYSNAGKELPIVYLSASFTAVTMPQIVRLMKNRDKDKSLAIWKNSSELCFMIMCMFSAVCVVFAPQIITILFSEKYLLGVDVFRIYSLTLLCRITYWGIILSASGRSKQILYSTAISLIFNVALNFVCYFIFGFIGPALATLLSLIITLFIQLILTSRHIGSPIPNLMPWKNMGKILFVNVVSGVAMYALVMFLGLGTSSLHLILTAVFGCLWCFVYCFLLRGRIRRLMHSINSIV